VTDRPLRILICEDDERLATLVTETLAADGRFDVVAHATNGEEAIRLTEELGPDIVLMDIGMPGLDGIDATRAIRERDERQHVVIYTGSAEYEDVGRADAVGAAGFLHKDALTSPDLPDAIQVLHTNFAGARTDLD
jgi:DNA-binding NarL/FixJ family response regulator